MSALLLLLAAALQPAPAAAPEPNWQSVGGQAGTETFFDPASVRPAGDKVQVRIRGVAATPGADGIASVTGLIELDCRARTRTSIEVRGYGSDGGLLLAALVPPAERVAEPIQPGGPTAAIAARLCGTRSQ